MFDTSVYKAIASEWNNSKYMEKINFVAGVFSALGLSLLAMLAPFADIEGIYDYFIQIIMLFMCTLVSAALLFSFFSDTVNSWNNAIKKKNFLWLSIETIFRSFVFIAIAVFIYFAFSKTIDMFKIEFLLPPTAKNSIEKVEIIMSSDEKNIMTVSGKVTFKTGRKASKYFVSLYVKNYGDETYTLYKHKEKSKGIYVIDYGGNFQVSGFRKEKLSNKASGFFVFSRKCNIMLCSYFGNSQRYHKIVLSHEDMKFVDSQAYISYIKQ